MNSILGGKHFLLYHRRFNDVFSCAEDLPLAVLLLFCSEGDNIPDAFTLVNQLDDWLHLLDSPVSDWPEQTKRPIEASKRSVKNLQRTSDLTCTVVSEPRTQPMENASIMESSLRQWYPSCSVLKPSWLGPRPPRRLKPTVTDTVSDTLLF